MGWFEKWQHGQPVVTREKEKAQVFTDLREAEGVENDLIRLGWNNPLIQNKNDEFEAVKEKQLMEHQLNVFVRFRETFFKAGKTYTTQEMIEWWEKEIQLVNNVYTQPMEHQLSVIIADCIIDSQRAEKSANVGGDRLVQNVDIMFRTKRKLEKLFGVGNDR